MTPPTAATPDWLRPVLATPAARTGVRLALVAGLLALTLYNLTGYPLTWFDEGSHLHVPKTLVQYGVYADHSSDGFRHYGPTVGVGPTVMLPVALVFQVFGVGLLQARLTMARYLLLAVGAMYGLARFLGGPRLAWAAALLLVLTPGIGMLEYGRQVLGEVPGLFYMLSGFWVWFAAWQAPSGAGRIGRLIAAGLLLGLATVTKNQYLLVLAPTLLFAWVANLAYYRSAPQHVFLIPGVLTAGCFALWQVVLVASLGPATVSENLALLTESTAGAALVFSPELMRTALGQLLSLKVFVFALPVAVAYGVRPILPRQPEAHQWAILLCLVVFNLLWFVVASIGWLRYAFPALALACLFVARLFSDLTAGYQLDWRGLRAALRPLAWRPLGRGLALAWLGVILVVSLAYSARAVFQPVFNAPLAMAEYLNTHVPPTARVETWEPEMSFLTDHVYSSPPAGVLPKAVSHISQGGPPPSEFYDFEQWDPDYVLVGKFGGWVNVYAPEKLHTDYELEVSIGYYDLYRARR